MLVQLSCRLVTFSGGRCRRAYSYANAVIPNATFYLLPVLVVTGNGDLAHPSPGICRAMLYRGGRIFFDDARMRSNASFWHYFFCRRCAKKWRQSVEISASANSTNTGPTSRFSALSDLISRSFRIGSPKWEQHRIDTRGCVPFSETPKVFMRSESKGPVPFFRIQSTF